MFNSPKNFQIQREVAEKIRQTNLRQSPYPNLEVHHAWTKYATDLGVRFGNSQDSRIFWAGVLLYLKNGYLQKQVREQILNKFEPLLNSSVKRTEILSCFELDILDVLQHTMATATEEVERTCKEEGADYPPWIKEWYKIHQSITIIKGLNNG